MKCACLTLADCPHTVSIQDLDIGKPLSVRCHQGGGGIIEANAGKPGAVPITAAPIMSAVTCHFAGGPTG